jgi:hypothetical protein
VPEERREEERGDRERRGEARRAWRARTRGGGLSDANRPAAGSASSMQPSAITAVSFVASISPAKPPAPTAASAPGRLRYRQRHRSAPKLAATSRTSWM